MSNQAPLPTLDQIIANVTGGAPLSGGTSAGQAAHAVKEVDSNPEVAEVAPEGSLEVAEVAAEPVAEVAPVAAEPEKRDPASSRFAALSRKEREVRQREQEAINRLKAAEERTAELEKREARFSELKKSPLKILKEMGLTYADITQDAVGAYESPKEDPVETRFSELQKQIDEARTVREELKAFKQAQEQREVDAALSDVMDNIRETAADDKYEYISTVGEDAYVLVKDVMAEYYQQHQKLLNYEEACDIVEKHYEDSLVSKLVGTKKVKSRFATSTSVETASAPKPSVKKEATGRPTTLTNQQSSATRATVDIDKLSKSEALAALTSKLRFHD